MKINYKELVLPSSFLHGLPVGLCHEIWLFFLHILFDTGAFYIFVIFSFFALPGSDRLYRTYKRE